MLKLKSYFRLCFITFILCCINQALAFNFEYCGQGTKKYRGFVFLDVFSSTSQFVSSWGECSLLLTVKDQKEHFYINNYDQLKINIAIGQGEHLASLASLYECKNSNINQVVKQNYPHIYLDDHLKNTYGRLDNILVTNCQ